MQASAVASQPRRRCPHTAQPWPCLGSEPPALGLSGSSTRDGCLSPSCSLSGSESDAIGGDSGAVSPYTGLRPCFRRSGTGGSQCRARASSSRSIGPSVSVSWETWPSRVLACHSGDESRVRGAASWAPETTALESRDRKSVFSGSSPEDAHPRSRLKAREPVV